jgi:hypothetical protein
MRGVKMSKKKIEFKTSIKVHDKRTGKITSTVIDSKLVDEKEVREETAKLKGDGTALSNTSVINKCKMILQGLNDDNASVSYINFDHVLKTVDTEIEVTESLEISITPIPEMLNDEDTV